MQNIQTIMANLQHAKRNHETLTIGGGEFSPAEIIEAIKPKSVKLEIHSVSISWSTSRGRDTYGYNICRAVSRQTGKTYRTIGGGYDMTGTVIGDWFEAEYQAELQALYARDHLKFKAYSNTGHHAHCELYGLFARPDGSIYMDGGTGIECMLRIIEACGFEYQRQYNPRTKSKATTGYLISKEIGE